MSSADQFEMVVSAHYEALFRFAMSLAQAESDAQDLLQQTFYAWAAKGHQLGDMAKVKTWLFTRLHRTFLAGRRSRSRFTHHNLEKATEELPAVSPMRFDQVDSRQVLAALARLEIIYQAPVALFYLENCPCKVIAEILELPIGMVKSRLSRGIAQLREILLVDGFRGSSLNRDGISSFANGDEPVARGNGACLSSARGELRGPNGAPGQMRPQRLSHRLVLARPHPVLLPHWGRRCPKGG
jgi:RNA polymerase sigma-70 factor (ECF subfamily)